MPLAGVCEREKKGNKGVPCFLRVSVGIYPFLHAVERTGDVPFGPERRNAAEEQGRALEMRSWYSPVFHPSQGNPSHISFPRKKVTGRDRGQLKPLVTKRGSRQGDARQKRENRWILGEHEATSKHHHHGYFRGKSRVRQCPLQTRKRNGYLQPQPLSINSSSTYPSYPCPL